MDEHLAVAWTPEAADALQRPRGVLGLEPAVQSLALIGPQLVFCTPASGSSPLRRCHEHRGLEYHHVIVIEPGDIVAAEPRGYSRLCVELTRAVVSVVVLHDKSLPVPVRPDWAG
jgi:hypothetical protein